MSNKRKIAFDDMPAVMADLVDEVRSLAQCVREIREMKIIGSDNIEISSGRVVYSTDQVCKILHKTRGTIYRMVSRGELPGYKSGKNLVFFEDEIMDWLIKSKRLTAEEMIQAVDKRDSVKERRVFA